MSDFQRYLEAKRTVDDRALDRRLIDSLRRAVADRADAREGPLRVLEVGAGVGTMIRRFVEWEVFPPGETSYTAVDVRGANVSQLRESVRSWAGGDRYEDDQRTVTVDAVTAEATAFIASRDREFDLLVGAALLDVLPREDLPALLGALAEGGICYFPITFDGGTRFLPPHPADRAVERQYHRHMDEKAGGSSRAGGDTLQMLREHDGASVLGAAGSDWVVRPTADGYPDDEAFFLRYILDTIETAVGEVSDESTLPPGTLSDWLDTRREHLDAGELVYLTHQLDLLGTL